jgi:hypothetical protein
MAIINGDSQTLFVSSAELRIVNSHSIGFRWIGVLVTSAAREESVLVAGIG